MKSNKFENDDQQHVINNNNNNNNNNISPNFIGKKRSHSDSFNQINKNDDINSLKNNNNIQNSLERIISPKITQSSFSIESITSPINSPISPINSPNLFKFQQDEIDEYNNDVIQLPIDILEMVFSQLSFPDRCNCAWVCHTWRSTLMMKPNELLENCLISLHHPPPKQTPLLPIGSFIEKLNITIAPCSCHLCYIDGTPYRNLKEWIEYIKPACFKQHQLKKVILRVFHNPTPYKPPESPLLRFQHNHHNHSSSSSFASTSCMSPSMASSSSIHTLMSPPPQPPSTTFHSGGGASSSMSNSSSLFVKDRDPNGIFSPLHECNTNHGLSRDILQQQNNFLDLEKPLALPLHDIGAVVPISILSSLLDTRICDLKLRVCIDLPYSTKKEDEFYEHRNQVEKLSEIGLITHNPLDSSFSSAVKCSEQSLEKVFSSLFRSPSTFINLQRLFLVTTTLDKVVLDNFSKHLPRLHGLHLSVWNSDLNVLFENITLSFGSRLKELSVRFTTCSGIKYSTAFSHRDRKLEDSMIDLLTTKCPNLEYFSFEGWLESITDQSLKYLNRLKLKHLVLKNGPDSRVCRPIWARLRLEVDYSYGLISENEMKNLISNQPSLKVFEIYATEIEKFTSSPHIYNSNSHYHPFTTISDDFINFLVEKCPQIRLVRVVDSVNDRSFVRGNRSKYLRQFNSSLYLSQLYNQSLNNNTNYNNSNQQNNSNNNITVSGGISCSQHYDNNRRYRNNSTLKEKFSIL